MKIPPDRTIHTLCISGGGAQGLQFYAILRESAKAGLWHPENIRSCFSTSVGSIVTTVVTLSTDWDSLDNYLVKRPWWKLFNMDIATALKSFENRGMMDQQPIRQLLLPLLALNDLSVDITLAEFYAWKPINMYFYTTNMETMESCQIHYKTHPQWKLVDAIYASACLPVLFQPFRDELGSTFVDGALTNDYPLLSCLDEIGHDESDCVLGILVKNQMTTGWNEESNLLDFLLTLMKSLVKRAQTAKTESIIILHEFCVFYPVNGNALAAIYNFAYSEEERQRLLDAGTAVFGRI